MRHFSIFMTFLVVLTAGCGGAEEQETGYADEMAEQHEGDTAEATEITDVEPAVPVVGEAVTYGTVDGNEVAGYLVQPEDTEAAGDTAGDGSDGARPGLIVVHEWWGLNDNVRAMARRLAGEGLNVLAVDLYEGRVTEEPEEARELVSEAMQDTESMQAHMWAANQYLRNELNAPRVGVLGWCFGGTVTMRTAVNMPDQIDAAVIYYGEPELAPERLRQVDMPVLGIFGGKDESIPQADVDSFRQVLEEENQDAEIHIYDDAGHAFANPSGENYVPGAAIDAWRTTQRFLDEQLLSDS